MPLVVKRIDTGQIVYRSGPDFNPGFGILNASRMYNLDPAILQEVVVTDSEWNDYVQSIPQRRMSSDINANLPSWDQVQTAIQNANTLADLRAILLKMARVLYWLAKNTEI